MTRTERRVSIGSSLLVAIGLLAAVACPSSPSAAATTMNTRASGRESATGGSGVPIFGEAQREYTTMVATRYQHHNVENEANRTYFYDCVGFVSYAMSRAAPTAWATTRATLKIPTGKVPAPSKYVSLFNQVNAGASLAGWAPISSVAALQPGDVVAWSYDAGCTKATGHSVVIGGSPTKTGPDSYSVLVYDSTASPHGPNDTRLTNPANKPGPNGKPSGLGQGTIGVLVTPQDQIRAVQWSAGGSAVPAAHYGMARPTS